MSIFVASEHTQGKRRRLMRRMVAGVIGLALGLSGAVAVQAPAQAAPVTEIEGSWLNTPATIGRGEPVVAEWRVNLNDDAQPPSNEPVDNVVATFTAGKAVFDGIPDLCLTTGVDPMSSISADGSTLTCNFGTLDQGTALVLQTPVVAQGLTGEEVTAIGISPDGETVDLPPIPILNDFALDFQLGQNTGVFEWSDDFTGVDLDLEWSLRLGKGSDPGPDEVTYRLTASEINGAAVSVGAHVVGGEVGCTTFGWYSAQGHPWSMPGLPADQVTSFVDECILTAVPGQPGQFDLTLRGINYDLLAVPSKDSTVALLPPDWDYVASGSLWFHTAATTNGSLVVTANTPTYTSTTGLTATDPGDNNATNKTYTLPGGWSTAFERSFTGSGGTPWDTTYGVAAGTQVQQRSYNAYWADQAPPETPFGNCLALDTRYLTLDAASMHGFDQYHVVDLPGILVQYYVGGSPVVDPNSASYDPRSFNCGLEDGGWSTTPPADLSTVRALRSTWPFSTFATHDIEYMELRALTTIKDTVPVGQDVWTFGGAMWRGFWANPIDQSANIISSTPNARYPNTTASMDILRIVTATPFIQKSAAQALVTPGVPTEFTLTYSANGAGAVPDTVDDYVITDILPLGMTYEPASAAPEPDVTTNPGGQQILTWTFDGVTTNTEHTLTYEAVASTDVEPGTQLTNTVTSLYDGATSSPAAASVTTATNGYTTILKTSDVDFISNINGDGVGSGSWTVTLESRDPQPQAFTDTIDILPYNGDQRGTSFSGSYTLDDVVLPNGGTVYYTDADPATLSDDPADAANGSAGDTTGNTVGWTTTKPANPTAIRVIGGQLLSGGTFSFQVPITTDGATPQDVYVNRAQARAEHSGLPMRTSAALVVTDYTVEKTSDPEDGATVKPGDTIEYTITVTQQGSVPAGAVFTDTLTDVLDDADYNNDLATDIGTATLTDDVIDWSGTIPVGGVAHITYSVTVKDASELEAGDGNTLVANQVTSPGCDDADVCGTEHPVGYYTVSKTADPASGEAVSIGDVVTYNVQVVQHGQGAVEGAFVDDDLTAVLDAATWNDDAQATSGDVSFTEPTLSWTGDLAVGDVVDLTYSVEVTGGGDYQLDNVVTSVCAEGDADCVPGECVPAPDQNADCATTHPIGAYQVTKTSDPTSGSTVQVGEDIEYTVTVTSVGKAAVDGAHVEDDLSAVLDDATYNGDLAATAGEAAIEGSDLTWTGDLAVGDVVTITYSVKVTAAGDYLLKNVVTTGGECVPAPNQTEACTTEHLTGTYTYSKTSDPAPGTTVRAGSTITYTVTVAQVGEGEVTDAIVEDDLSGVLDDATLNPDDVETDSGTATLNGSTLTWTGDLAVGQVVTITYSVTVQKTDAGDTVIRNVVTSPDSVECVPAADQNPDCQTEHYTGSYTYSKTSSPASGATVKVGDTIEYTVTVTQVGSGGVDNAIVTDDLSAVLDDATMNGEPEADSGTVTLSGDDLTWTGDLAVGQVVTITYSVTVTGGDDGDTDIRNLVTSTDTIAECVPAADGNPDCTTGQIYGTYTYSKMSNPTSPSTVQVGDTIEYTVTLTQEGLGAVPGATVVDDLSDVLDDATVIGEAVADSGTVTLSGETLTWTGDLAVDQVVTITYSVQVVGGGDTTVRNVVTSPDEGAECVAAVDGTPDCATIHKYGGYTYSKTSNPASGSDVKSGDTIDYTVTVTQTGEGAVDAAIVEDDLSAVLDDADWVGNESATGGEVVRDGDALTWTGPLEVGDVVTITYSVTVTGNGDQHLRNVVTSPDETAACVPAADQNVDCTTEHDYTPPLSGGLADTGAAATGWLVLGSGLIGMGLLLIVAIGRRRRSA